MGAYIVALSLLGIASYFERLANIPPLRPMNQIADLVFAAGGALSSLSVFALLGVGFFVYAWWVPIAAAVISLIVGILADKILPDGGRPGLSVLAAVAGACVVVWWGLAA